jgi:hypothetical protein
VARLSAHRAAGEKAGPSGKASSSEAIEIGVWAWPTDYFATAHMMFEDKFLEVRPRRSIVVFIISSSSSSSSIIIIIIIITRSLSLVMSSLPRQLGCHQRHTVAVAVWQYLLTSYSDDSVSYTWNEYSLDQQQDFVDSMTNWQVRDYPQDRSHSTACMHHQVNWRG